MNLTEIKNKIIQLEEIYGKREIHVPTLNDDLSKIIDLDITEEDDKLFLVIKSEWKR